MVPVLAPKILWVDAPDAGLDPVFVPKVKLGCGVAVFPNKDADPLMAPPNRFPAAGFDVAGVD